MVTQATQILRPGPLEKAGRAIEARLKLVCPPTVFDHHWVPARVDSAVWQQLTRKPPFVGIGFNRFGRGEGHAQLFGPAEFTVFCAIANPSGTEARLFGDTIGPGVLTVAQVIAVALHAMLIPGIGTVQVGEISHAYVDGLNADNLAMATIDLTVKGIGIEVGDMLAGDLLTPTTPIRTEIDWRFTDGPTWTEEQSA